MQQYYGDTPHIIDKKRKKRVVKRKTGGLTPLSLVVILVFTATIIALLWAVSPLFEKSGQVGGKNWYFVCVYTETTSEKAQISANSVRERGGAGYVINDGKYRITASVYDSEKDAKKVAKTIDGSTVYTLKIDAISLPNFDDEKVKNEIKNAFSFYERIYEEINGVVTRYEEKKIEESVLAYALEKCKNEVTSLREKMQAVYNETGLSCLNALCDYLDGVVGDLTTAITDGNGSMSSRVRYLLCSLIRRRALLSNAVN